MTEYEVMLKSVEPVHVAGIRRVISNYQAVGSLFTELSECLKESNIEPIGPGIAIWYDPEFKEHSVDGEAAVPVHASRVASAEVNIHELPAVLQMACTFHRGSFDKLPAAYNAIGDWIKSNGYKVIGPIREVYVEMNMDGNPNNHLTEIQFPVVKL